MATARVEDEPLKCPICYEHFNRRTRQLPCCLHVFCENCLLTYIGNVKSEDDSERIFQCPVCRKQVAIPLGSTELSEWVKSLELKLGMESKSNAAEGVQEKSPCSPCKEIEKIVSAEKFCIDCQELLCKTCSRMIHSMKLMKNHYILDMRTGAESEETDVTQMLTEYFSCSRHSDRAVSYICHEHDDLYCIRCIIENHRHCKGVKDLKDPANKTETETYSSEMKDQIQYAFLQIKAITDFRKNDVAENTEKAGVICTQIREIRTKLNTVFDALEENVQIKAKSFVKNYNVEADDESKMLEEKKQQLTAFSSLIRRIETEGSHSHLFIVLRKLKSKVIEIENEVVEFGTSCCRHELRLLTEEKLNDLMEIGPNDTSQLATVTEDLSVVILPAFPKKNLLDMTAKKVAEHDILAKTSPKPEPTYSGVLSLGTGQLMLVDNYYGLCCLTDKDYKPTASCYSRFNDFSEKPFCAARVKTGLIAVSVPNQKKIYLFSKKEEAENIPIKDVVNTRLTPKAICGLKTGDIAISWENPVAFGILAFRISHPTSYEEKIFLDHDTAGRTFKAFDYMAVDEERSHVIQPCKRDKAVYCFDFCGNPKFAYKHDKLGCPNGVACDGQGNIYICDSSNSSIHVVSAEGVGTRVITEGCPGAPLAIAFHSDGIRFAVTNNGRPWNRVTVFKLLQEAESS